MGQVVKRGGPPFAAAQREFKCDHGLVGRGWRVLRSAEPEIFDALRRGTEEETFSTRKRSKMQHTELHPGWSFDAQRWGPVHCWWGRHDKWFDARDPMLCCSCSLFLNHSGDAQGVRHQQGLHFSTASHLRVRWLKPLVQFSPQYQRTRHKEGVFQIIGPTEQRAALQRLRARGEIGEEAFHRIQEELDWSELDAAPAGTFQSLAS